MKNTDFFSEEEILEIRNEICQKFDKFDNERQKQISHIQSIKNAIYGDYNLGKIAPSLPDAWEQASTLKAHLLEAISSHPEGLFDVSENDNQTSQRANAHKIFLCDVLDKIKFNNKIEKIIDRLVEEGEITLFVGWESRFITKRRTISLFDKINSNECKNFKIIREKIYEGANVSIIKACDFVFDVKRKENFDSCPKIQRSFMDLNEILENDENFTLNNQQKEELKLRLKEKEGDDNNLIEVLKFWGDFKLHSGRVLKNRLIVVIDRLFVVQNEPNPYVINPFIHSSLICDPHTKRGISPLAPILPVLSCANEIMQTQVLGHKLVSNPPFLAPKGAFCGEINIKPGKIIEYDSALLPQMPQPINFSQIFSGWDFIKFFKSEMERATGIFDNMAGQVKQQARTATEINASTSGQNARLNRFIDIINRRIIIPLIEKIALTNSNFTIGNTNLTTQIEGKTVTLEITPEIREANFIYRYSDKKAGTDRILRQKEIENTISQFAKIPELSNKINWEECFKHALSNLGVENTAKFIKTQIDSEAKNEIHTT